MSIKVRVDLREIFPDLRKGFVRRFERRTRRLDLPMLNSGSCAHVYPLLMSGARNGIFVDRDDWSGEIPEEIRNEGGHSINATGNNPRTISFTIWGERREIFFYEIEADKIGEILGRSKISYYYSALSGGPPLIDEAFMAVEKGGYLLVPGEILDPTLCLDILGLKLCSRSYVDERISGWFPSFPFSSLYEKNRNVGQLPVIGQINEYSIVGENPGFLEYINRLAYAIYCFRDAVRRLNMNEPLSVCYVEDREKYIADFMVQHIFNPARKISGLPEPIRHKIMKWFSDLLFYSSIKDKNESRPDIEELLKKEFSATFL